MELLSLNHIYRVYSRHVDEHGDLKRRLMGRFLVYEKELHILEDPFGILSAHLGEGPMDEKKEKALRQLQRSSHLEVMTESDLKEGKALDLIPEDDLGQAGTPPVAGKDVHIVDEPQIAVAQEPPMAARPPPIFWYLRQGYANPQTLELAGGRVFLNGVPLGESEVIKILENINTGRATLRYKRQI